MMAFSGDDVVQYACEQLRPRTGRTIVAPSVWVDELHKIKDLGIAFDHEEATLGVTCVAVPVLSRNGKVVAAVSVAGPVGRLEPGRKASLVRDAVSKSPKNSTPRRLGESKCLRSSLDSATEILRAVTDQLGGTTPGFAGNVHTQQPRGLTADFWLTVVRGRVREPTNPRRSIGSLCQRIDLILTSARFVPMSGPTPWHPPRGAYTMHPGVQCRRQ